MGVFYVWSCDSSLSLAQFVTWSIIGSFPDLFFQNIHNEREIRSSEWRLEIRFGIS